MCAHACASVWVGIFGAQTERLQLVLGSGNTEPEAKLLLLMFRQNREKHDKWLYKVLLVMSDLMVSLQLMRQLAI